MSSAQYLERRASGIYFVRLYVPARLKAAVGKGEIHRTTGCRDYRLAKIVAGELADRCKEFALGGCALQAATGQRPGSSPGTISPLD